MDHQAQAYVAPKIMAEQNGKPRTAAAAASSNNGGSKPTTTTKTFPKWGGAEICPRCQKSVFIAELMRGAGQAWHKTCFLCFVCSKRIDSSNMCERDSEIYCRGETTAQLVVQRIVHPITLIRILLIFSLLRQKLRAKRIRLWHWCWDFANDLKI